MGRRHVTRLMRRMGIEAIYRKKRTSVQAKGHTIYPYLLSGVVVERPNQVWAADITYLPMARGFVYLVAILDLYSRKTLAWRTSTTMTSDFCIEAVQAALTRFGRPEIFITDQRSPFTAEAFTDVLKAHGVAISMDGKGRWVDNVFIERLWRSVKYEEVYLHAYESPKEVNAALTRYFAFYNTRRPHQALDQRTPDALYFADSTVKWAARRALRRPSVCRYADSLCAPHTGLVFNPRFIHLSPKDFCPNNRSHPWGHATAALRLLLRAPERGL